MTERRVSVPRPYVVASVTSLVLAVVASGVGLLVPGVYRDAAVLLPQLRGQDLLTLVVACPALAVSLYAAVRGSVRGYIAWIGVTGYLLYTYATYAFMTAFNELYLVYVALFALTFYTFVGGVVRLDATLVKRALDGHSVTAYVWFQIVVAVAVGLLWTVDVVTAILAGARPTVLAGTGLPTPVVQSLDLAVLVPAFGLSAYWLRRRRPWGYVLTGVLLVKSATLGLAVLAMAVLQMSDGQSVALPMLVVFGVVSGLALVLTGRFVLALEPSVQRVERSHVSRSEGESKVR
ncbi:hypothetical protein SAMN04487950_0645 [Halogranum rubrum]|uniref:Uncharacterized protein n=1 Tax=Halogranum rubrum TaxID=553466 RepID=A0A1I4BM38_9EURY|nr:hypothetical protein [Halogranum rubrum]SFK69785.1 hypothetical protein SAMN04487950_0645 [Halogranum rubrum]